MAFYSDAINPGFKFMGTTRKIIGWITRFFIRIIIIFMAIILTFILVFNTPVVQSYLTENAGKYLKNKIGTHVSLGGLR